MTPTEHIRGHGCAKCGKQEAGNKNKSNLKDFVDACTTYYNNFYDYSLVREYKNCTQYTTVICPLHGEFKTTFSNHKKGSGCPDCGNRKIGEALASNTAEFTVKATKVHGGRYDYSIVNYTNNSTKVKIGCSLHGIFEQEPSNHLNGQGCPYCQKNGYSRSKPGSFYVLHSDEYTKVGITNRSVFQRAKEISKRSGKQFAIISESYFEDGVRAWEIEKNILSYLRDKYKPVDSVFDGSTECFIDVSIEDLLNKIAPMSNLS